MTVEYQNSSACLQSAMDKATRELATRHHGELLISGGGIIHIQVRLPAEHTQKFIGDVNAAVCGQIQWSIS